MPIDPMQKKINRRRLLEGNLLSRKSFKTTKEYAAYNVRVTTSINNILKLEDLIATNEKTLKELTGIPYGKIEQARQDYEDAVNGDINDPNYAANVAAAEATWNARKDQAKKVENALTTDKSTLDKAKIELENARWNYKKSTIVDAKSTQVTGPGNNSSGSTASNTLA